MAYTQKSDDLKNVANAMSNNSNYGPGGKKKKKKKDEVENTTSKTTEISKEEIMANLDSKLSRISPEMGGDRGPGSTEEEVELNPATTTVTSNVSSGGRKRRGKGGGKNKLPLGKRLKYGLRDVFTTQNKQKAKYTGARKTVKRRKTGRIPRV